MTEIRYTLLSDGSSDDALLPVLTWLLIEHRVTCAIQAEWADLRPLPNPPKRLTDRIQTAVDLYPCQLLFVHRDAEAQSYGVRKGEILAALAKLPFSPPPAVCVVPVRMQEAWLLIDECALRRASGNPNGIQPLPLPDLAGLERLPDPKQVLYDLLRQASGRSGRRLKKLRLNQCAKRVADYVTGFESLRALPAFQALENDVEQLVQERGWAMTS